MRKNCKKIIYMLSVAVLCTSCSKQTSTTPNTPSPVADSSTSLRSGDLKALFAQWDSKVLKDKDKNKILTQFEDYLNENAETISEDKLKELSGNFSYISKDKVNLITYIETAELYGAAGRDSYTWAVSGKCVKPLFTEDTKYIESLVQEKKNPEYYYVISNDYLITTTSGIAVSRIKVSKNKMEIKPDVIKLSQNNRYHKDFGVLYGKHQLKVDKISDDASSITVSDIQDKTSLKLKLTDKHTFS